ncbi:ATP-grasp domain-containing protein [uncultured Hyphomicrobium sp.]|uniref:D-alanine--D-alanine ligase family protein n=1 Tax=uncultured Hyphomicrobium sp. TaxID=194373 RepID=UPI0025DD6D23|nr:ATP-grasp domain-containing protein [uncultured Hyphomicrobium sp.]
MTTTPPTIIRKPRKRLTVVLLTDERLLPAGDLADYSDKQRLLRKTEFDVKRAVETLGHQFIAVGLSNDLSTIRGAIDAHKPDIVFNLAEDFDGIGHFDQHVVSFLELLRQPYTGCNPRGLTIARDKALTKKILAYDGLKVPEFAIFPMKRVTKRPSELGFPLFVKSLTEEGSVGISGASIVYDDVRLMERVDYIHRTAGTAAVAEQFIEGREIYVGIMGNERATILPPWEFFVENRKEGAPLIATGRGKWDPEYQDQAGVMTGPAEISEKLAAKLEKLSREIYRLLSLSGYARLDFRVTPSEDVYLIEANPNPQIASDEDFASSAEYAGIQYPELIERLIRFGMNYNPERMIL